MKMPVKVLLLELWFFVLYPIMGLGLILAFGQLGMFLYFALFVLWCWELFAFCHYRYCRQEEFLHVLNTAAALGAPIEAVLKAHLQDRPRGSKYRFWTGALLFFVFPGFYWWHKRRRFDYRVALVAQLLEKGVPLEQALAAVPGVVSRETALAVTVGQFTGKLASALQQLPGRRPAPLWLELVPRLLYPLFVLSVMLANVMFLSVFIIPKFEMIFADFKLKLPWATSLLVDTSRWIGKFPFTVPLAWLLLLTVVNVALFSSGAKWYYPLVGRLYRMHVRGQFLQVLGLMLETGKPVPLILSRALESRLLPRVLEMRVDHLADDLEQGEPMAASLAKHGLIAGSMVGLIAAAERAQNLPWALQELGHTLVQRCSRISYRLSVGVFPLTILACACLVGFVAIAMLSPMIGLMRGLGG